MNERYIAVGTCGGASYDGGVIAGSEGHGSILGLALRDFVDEHNQLAFVRFALRGYFQAIRHLEFSRIFQVRTGELNERTGLRHEIRAESKRHEGGRIISYVDNNSLRVFKGFFYFSNVFVLDICKRDVANTPIEHFVRLRIFVDFIRVIHVELVSAVESNNMLLGLLTRQIPQMHALVA